MGFLIRAAVLVGLGAGAYVLIDRERREIAERRGQRLDFEARVAALEPPEGGLPNAETFKAALEKVLERARAKGAPFVDVSAGALHRATGGYPGPHHRLDACCVVMRGALKRGDMVLQEPRSGSGATLTLRYHLAD
ncbi:MAG: hypothetical protein JWL79_3877 [Frankiales bacterium]|nr:hypothetical protein [Frankiales bacterium]